ncbi:MAG: hypothetical protein QNJ98_06335 [Planctomycetota bacterium]|nr:hypothetical protein [Planctomycetota bacterium]
MRRAFATLLILACVVPAFAEDEPAKAAPKPHHPERVWEGYLWKDEQGRLRIGWPVIAMGVMAQPEHVIDVEDVKRFEPLLAPAKDYYVFWNYRLEEDFAKTLPKLPKVLVRVRGPVETKSQGGRDGIVFGDGTLTMKAPRFLSIEFVSDAWLKAWAPIFREPWSPWRIRDRPPGDKEAETKKLVPRMVKTLEAMRKITGPTDAQRTLAAKIAPKAKVVTWFRERQETDLLRWIRIMATKHDLAIEGLDALGSVPPTGMELQRWFVQSKSPDAFLALVRAKWKGPLGRLELLYYERNESGGVSLTEVGLDVVETWDQRVFLGHQRLTRETLKK